MNPLRLLHELRTLNFEPCPSTRLEISLENGQLRLSCSLLQLPGVFPLELALLGTAPLPGLQEPMAIHGHHATRPHPDRIQPPLQPMPETMAPAQQLQAWQPFFWRFCHEGVLLPDLDGYTAQLPGAPPLHFDDPHRALEHEGGQVTHLGHFSSLQRKGDHLELTRWGLQPGNVHRWLFRLRGESEPLWLVGQEDSLGRRMGYTLDRHGQTVELRQPLTQRKVQLIRREDGQLERLVLILPGEAPQVCAQLSYTREGQLEEVRGRGHSRWQLEYTPAGQLRSLRHAGGKGCTLEWDDDGRCLAVRTEGAETLYRLKYQPELGQTQVQTAGAPQLFMQDKQRKTLTRVWEGGLQERLELDPLGRPIVWERLPGPSCRLQYDEAGNLTRWENALGARWQLEHDPEHRVIACTTPALKTWRLHRREDDRAAELLTPSGERRLIRRDAEGRWLSGQSHAGIPWQLLRSAEGLQQSWEVGAQSEQLQFNALGRLISRQRPQRLIQRLTLNDQDQPVTLESPLPSQFRYDDRGRCVEYLSPHGGRWQLTYNTHGRLETLQDPLRYRLRFFWSLTGQLLRVLHGSTGLMEVEYDASGHLSTLKLPGELVMKLARAVDGRLEQLKVGNQPWQRLEPKSAARHATPALSAMPTSPPHLSPMMAAVEVTSSPDGVTCSRNADGLITERHFPGGFLEQWQYDGLGRPVLRRLHWQASPERRVPVFDEKWLWKEQGGCLCWEGQLHSPEHATPTARWKRRFEHNRVGRLTRVEVEGIHGEAQVHQQEQYVYDGLGRLSLSPHGSWRYTPQGLLEAAGNHCWSWDARGEWLQEAWPEGWLKRTSGNHPYQMTWKGHTGEELRLTRSPHGTLTHIELPTLTLEGNGASESESLPGVCGWNLFPKTTPPDTHDSSSSSTQSADKALSSPSQDSSQPASPRMERPERPLKSSLPALQQLRESLELQQQRGLARFRPLRATPIPPAGRIWGPWTERMAWQRFARGIFPMGPEDSSPKAFLSGWTFDTQPTWRAPQPVSSEPAEAVPSPMAHLQLLRQPWRAEATLQPEASSWPLHLERLMHTLNADTTTHYDEVSMALYLLGLDISIQTEWLTPSLSWEAKLVLSLALGETHVPESPPQEPSDEQLAFWPQPPVRKSMEPPLELLLWVLGKESPSIPALEVFLCHA
ncbi:MAG: hypothetical protein ACKO6N_01135 [Myxococcota bacterium]